MPRVKLTGTNVGRLPAGPEGMAIYWDTELPGFYLRVTSVRTFGVWYRVRGRARRMGLGRWPVAKVKPTRKRAEAVLAAALQGEDLRTPRCTYDLEQLTHRYVEAHVENLSTTTTRDYLRILKRHVSPAAVARRPAAQLERAELRTWLEAIAARTPVMANRVFQLMRAVFRWAVREELLKEDPSLGIQRPRREAPRERVLSDGELKGLWLALDDEPAQPATVVRMFILLGQRYTETVLMRWADVDLEGKVWRIPGEVRKGGRFHVVPLPAVVVQLLQDLRVHVGETERVFPGVYVTNPSKWFVPLRDRLVTTTGGQKWTCHDLRRTCATGLARTGASRNTIALVLGHETREGGAVTGVYDRFDRLPERAAALNAWATHVQQLATGAAAAGAGKVVSISRA